jgi:hypothetical protein
MLYLLYLIFCPRKKLGTYIYIYTYIYIMCVCDIFPGTSCDGNTFYFHGKKDDNFCIVTDVGLHINAHFIRAKNSMRECRTVLDV